MFNRRQIVALGLSSTIMPARVMAQTPVATPLPDLPFQNAWFINSATDVASPVASPFASPVATNQHGYLLGDSTSGNVLTIYADYLCHYCRAFHRDMEPRLIADFVVPGLLQLEMVDFPIIDTGEGRDFSDDTGESVQSAEAAASAAEQGAFLAYRELLYAGPETVSEGHFSDDNLTMMADSLGLDGQQFLASLSSGKYETPIALGSERGKTLGVAGTPAFSFNDNPPFYLTVGGYEDFAAMLESLLSD